MNRPSNRFRLRSWTGWLATGLLTALLQRAEVVTPAAVQRLAGSVRDRHPGLQALEMRASAPQAQAEGTLRWAHPTLTPAGEGLTPRGTLASARDKTLHRRTRKR